MRRNLRSQNRCGSCGYTWSPRGHNVSRACPNCRSANVSAPGFPLGCLIALLAVPGMCILSAVASAVFAGVAGAVNEASEALTGPMAPLFVVGGLLLAAGGATFAFRRYKATKRVEELLKIEADRAREYQEEQSERHHAAEAAHHAQQVSAEAQRAREYRDRLVQRFGEDAAAKIEAKELWVGATKEMVIEALGQPEDISEKVLKKKTKAVFKYYRRGRGYGLKVNFEDDEVVGWEK
jgi:uncharacterized membrane protein